MRIDTEHLTTMTTTTTTSKWKTSAGQAKRTILGALWNFNDILPCTSKQSIWINVNGSIGYDSHEWMALHDKLVFKCKKCMAL